MKYQVTGNEYVSLPTIRESDGAIESISCLYMNLKGMIELKGRNGLIRPFLQYDEKEIVPYMVCRQRIRAALHPEPGEAGVLRGYPGKYDRQLPGMQETQPRYYQHLKTICL